MKVCGGCKTSKDEADFYISKGNLTSWCRACYAAYYRRNRERQIRSNANARYKRRYGLTITEYEAFIAGGCDVCGATDVRIVVDHCHATDSVRAPLCDGCNVALGAAGDDPARLRALAEYVERHRQNPGKPIGPRPTHRGPRAPAIDIEELRSLYVGGMTQAKLAEKYGCSTPYITKLMKQHRITARPRGPVAA